MPAFNEWHRLSQPFLDPAKTRDDYLAAFLAELGKVRVPTGEGDTLNKVRENVSKLPLSELPVIPGMPGAPESWRRLTALHRELSRRCANGIYFLSYRDAAKVCEGVSYQQAHTITGALVRLGVSRLLAKARPVRMAEKPLNFAICCRKAKTVWKPATHIRDERACRDLANLPKRESPGPATTPAR